MSNRTYLWGSLPFSHDQALRWNLSHYYKGNIVNSQAALYAFNFVTPLQHISPPH